MLVVSDTGVGMDKETLDRIFEPFFTTKQVNEGTGLGLATVYGIVKTHGGYITCYSEPGYGTTFKLYFPASSILSVDAHREPHADRVEGGAETILVVDDDDAVLKLGKDILMRFGYHVMTADSGEEAMALFSAQHDQIDLIILDLNMPGMGGLKCLQEIRKIDSQAKILIASGYSPNGSVREIIGDDTNRFIGKPFQVKEILKKVRAVLELK
jgi:CheY-like chemotaxis protein